MSSKAILAGSQTASPGVVTTGAGSSPMVVERSPSEKMEKVGVTGVVLAGTHGWGACPLERVIPRPLSPIVNRPLIVHSLDWLHASGVRSACICGNSQTSAFRRSLTAGEASEEVPGSMRLEFYEDVAPRGPAGCVRDAASGRDCRAIVVVEGTILPQIELDRLLSVHQHSGATLTVAVTSTVPAAHPSEETLTPVGIYVFDESALSAVDGSGYQDIKETLVPRLHRQGKSVLTYRTEVPVPRVTGVDSYMAVSDWALTQLVRQEGGLAEYRRIGEALVHEGSSVDESARLEGPILIGADAVIGPRATIVGPTAIGRGTRVGSTAVVSRSVLWSRASVGRGAVVDRCVVTSNAVVCDGRVQRYVIASGGPGMARVQLS